MVVEFVTWGGLCVVRFTLLSVVVFVLFSLTDNTDISQSDSGARWGRQTVHVHGARERRGMVLAPRKRCMTRDMQQNVLFNKLDSLPPQALCLCVSRGHGIVSQA